MVRIGDRVEEYIIEEEVGRGGMGRVYRAVHEQIGQEVALKMLLPQFFDDERHLKRFLNEARVLVHLQHPNLVPLLGFPTYQGRPFIVMPFIEGDTLERLLAREGRLPLKRAVGIFTDICNGLTCVHENGVLHRDLKPANILIRATDGAALLTDFGIARAIGTERLTLTGMVVGTAEYLSPEQASGGSPDDPRSDVYAVGILLYEMLTGQVPFRHISAAQVLMKQVSAAPPPPRMVVPDLPQALCDALLRALEKDPVARFATAAEFLQAVEATVDLAPVDPEAPTSEQPATGPVLPTEKPAARPPEPQVSSTPPPTIQPARRQSSVGSFLRLAWRKKGAAALGAVVGAALAVAAWYVSTQL